MITDDQIHAASLELGLTVNPPAVRCAYEWLDAQKKTKQARRLFYPYKHIIETWAGYYTSEDDVSVAIHLHPDVVGRYCNFNLSSRLTCPSLDRLSGIPEAGSHPNYREKGGGTFYKVWE